MQYNNVNRLSQSSVGARGAILIYIIKSSKAEDEIYVYTQITLYLQEIEYLNNPIKRTTPIELTHWNSSSLCNHPETPITYILYIEKQNILHLHEVYYDNYINTKIL